MNMTVYNVLELTNWTSCLIFNFTLQVQCRKIIFQFRKDYKRVKKRGYNMNLFLFISSDSFSSSSSS